MQIGTRRKVEGGRYLTYQLSPSHYRLVFQRRSRSFYKRLVSNLSKTTEPGSPHNSLPIVPWNGRAPTHGFRAFVRNAKIPGKIRDRGPKPDDIRVGHKL